jgi:tRNA-dependent cyclodipeptide synthase
MVWLKNFFWDIGSWGLKMLVKSVVGLGAEALNDKKKYNAFLGVSVFNKFFTKEVFEKYALWCSEYFRETAILLMDDVERINFKLFKGLTEKESLKRAKESGENLRRAFEKVIRKNNISNVRIILLRDLKLEEGFWHNLKILQEEYNSNCEFKKLFKSLMLNIIGYKVEMLIENADDKTLDELSEYLKEELAAMLYLSENGYPIELDPYSEFSIKKDLYGGLLEDLKNTLELKAARGHIYVHPEGKEYGKKSSLEK